MLESKQKFKCAYRVDSNIKEKRQVSGLK